MRLIVDLIGCIIKLYIITEGVEFDIQDKIVIVVVLSVHLHAVLDDEVVGVLLANAELEHVGGLLASHSEVLNHDGHGDGALTFQLLLLFPLLRGDSLHV